MATIPRQLSRQGRKPISIAGFSDFVQAPKTEFGTVFEQAQIQTEKAAPFAYLEDRSSRFLMSTGSQAAYFFERFLKIGLKTHKLPAIAAPIGVQALRFVSVGLSQFVFGARQRESKNAETTRRLPEKTAHKPRPAISQYNQRPSQREPPSPHIQCTQHISSEADSDQCAQQHEGGR
jgi:hypothetical protein